MFLKKFEFTDNENIQFFFNAQIIFLLSTLIFQVFIISFYYSWHQHVLIILMSLIILYIFIEEIFNRREKNQTIPISKTEIRAYDIL